MGFETSSSRRKEEKTGGKMGVVWACGLSEADGGGGNDGEGGCAGFFAAPP